MPIQRKQVGSVDEFVREVCAIREKWTRADGVYFDPWFRGQSDATWSLTPSLYRADLTDEENVLRLEFKRKGLQMVDSRSARDDWDWYFLMQHYRCPTRLLDWTDSALIALFFAINSGAPSEHELAGNPGVWMLDPWWLNRVVAKWDSIFDPDFDQVKPYLPDPYLGRLRHRLPVAMDPPHIAQRVAVQRSRFTIHGTEPQGLELAARAAKARLVCIEIDRDQIARIRCDIYTCGITDVTVFPDMEGLGRELMRTKLSAW